MLNCSVYYLKGCILMEFIKKEISKGVDLYCSGQSKFKSGYISIRFIRPLTRETKVKDELAFNVLCSGCEKYPDLRSINVELQKLYDADINTSGFMVGDSRVMCLDVRMLDNSYSIDGTDITSGVLSFIKELLLRPALENGEFRADYTEIEKRKLIDSVNRKINNKRGYAYERMISVMCENEPFGLSTTDNIGDIEAVCPKCLTENYYDMLSTAKIEIYAVGQYDPEMLAGYFKEVFSGIERKDIFVPETKIIRTCGEMKTVREKQNVTQGKLCIGFRTGCADTDDDYSATTVMNSIFGGGTTGKLFMNVREKMSLCYYCSSSLNGAKGIMTVSSGIEFDKEKTAADAIFAQLEAVKNGDFTQDEIDDAKRDLINGLRSVNDSLYSIVGAMSECVRKGRNITTEEKIDKINAVTKEQIIEKARLVKPDTYYFMEGEAD